MTQLPPFVSMYRTVDEPNHNNAERNENKQKRMYSGTHSESANGFYKTSKRSKVATVGQNKPTLKRKKKNENTDSREKKHKSIGNTRITLKDSNNVDDRNVTTSSEENNPKVDMAVATNYTVKASMTKYMKQMGRVFADKEGAFAKLNSLMEKVLSSICKVSASRTTSNTCKVETCDVETVLDRIYKTLE